MKKIIINEDIEKRLMQNLVEVSLINWDSAVNQVYEYLRSSYYPAETDVNTSISEKTKKPIGIELNTDGQLTKSMKTIEQIFLACQNKYNDKFNENRDEIIKQAIKRWFRKGKD